MFSEVDNLDHLDNKRVGVFPTKMRLQLPNEMYLYRASQRFCSLKARKYALPIFIVADRVTSVRLLSLVKEEIF